MKEKHKRIDIYDYKMEVENYDGFIFEYSLEFEEGKFNKINYLIINGKSMDSKVILEWKKENLLLTKIVYDKIIALEKFFENKKRMKNLRS